MTFSVVATAIEIAASCDAVWDVLLDREQGRIWRGADFDTNWTPGAPISISSTLMSKRTNDKGEVLRVERPHLLIYKFLPRVSGLPDVPESYSLVTITLKPTSNGALLELEHTVPPSPVRRGKDFEIGPESGEKHVRFYWGNTLPLLRDMVEGRDSLALQMTRLQQS